MPTWTMNFSCADLFQPQRWRWVARRRAASPGPELSARRAEAMRGLFPKLASWIDRQTTMTAMAEAHSYLSQAADLGDLERRIREVERRSSAPRWSQ